MRRFICRTMRFKHYPGSNLIMFATEVAFNVVFNIHALIFSFVKYGMR